MPGGGKRSAQGGRKTLPEAMRGRSWGAGGGAKEGRAWPHCREGHGEACPESWEFELRGLAVVGFEDGRIAGGRSAAPMLLRAWLQGGSPVLCPGLWGTMGAGDWT